MVARLVRASLAVVPVLLYAAACSSGGGDDAPAFDGFAGKVSVLSPSSTVFESEPNDDPTQAQLMGTLSAGQTLTILGNTTDSGADPFDGFQFDSPQAVTVTATLNHDLANDFDFFVYDPVSQTVLFNFATANVPEVGIFAISGVFQLVVTSFSGEGDYTFDLAITPAPAGSAGFSGALYPEDSLTLSGRVDSAAGATERFLVSIPYAAHVEPALVSSGGARLEFALRDATLSRLGPLEISRFETSARAEGSSASLPALSLLEVEVRALDGAGDFELELHARAPAFPGPRSRIAPLAAEAELSRAARSGKFYGSAGLRCAPGEVLLLPREGADVERELHLAGARELARIPGGAWKVGFELGPGLTEEDAQRITHAVARSLSARPAFEYVEPNLVRQALGVPNDSYYNLQWHYPLIQLPAAWDITTGDDSVVVAVIDTGETAHPDLVNRTIPGYDLISDPTIAGDGDGVDPDPTDIGDGNPPNQPSSFHGTHVAGTIAAQTDNASGVAGVTWFGKVQHVRVLGKGGGTDFDIANGILWAAGLAVNGVPLNPTPALVLNLSLGGPGFSQTSQNAVTAARNAGAVVVAAAGNNNSPNLFFPASYQDVVSVSAVDLNSKKAPYSNFNNMVDVAAPGGDVGKDLNGDGYVDGVLSTLADDSAPPTTFVFKFYQGTSMACPHVAGVVALMREAAPAATPAVLEAARFSTCTDLGAQGKDNTFGHGLINAYQALLAVAGGGGPTPILSLSAQSLSLSDTLTTAFVQVANVGGGLLHVQTPIVTTEPPGGNWLSAVRILATNPTTTDTTAIRVDVTPGGLAAGIYQGNVEVVSDGGVQDIPVLLTISSGSTLDVDIFVLAVDIDTFLTVSQAIVNPTDSLAWQHPDLPNGDYLLAAGTDDDNDGFICGPGDLYCGLYPTLNQPTIVVKQPGQGKTGLNFAVSTAFQGAGAGTGGGKGFARLE